MDLALNDKVAVVTGGSLGIGKAIARELAIEGARVVICARRPGVLQEAASDIQRETGKEVLAVPADTTQADQVSNLFECAASHFGSVDILVNNAAVVGGLLQGPLEEATEELLTEDLDTKVVGYFRTAQAAAPLMKRQGWGRIINIGGMSGRYSGVISGVRNAAVAHLTKTLSGQLGPYGITVNTIHPGTVRTERTDEMYGEEAAVLGVPKEEVAEKAAGVQSIGRIVEADEIAHLVCFLASPKAAAITGEVIAVDGGRGSAVFF